MPSQIGAFALARYERPPRSAFIRLFFLAGRAQRQELGSFGSRSPRAPCLQVAVAADDLVTAQVALGSGQIVAGYAHIDASQRQVCWAECGRQVS